MSTRTIRRKPGNRQGIPRWVRVFFILVASFSAMMVYVWKEIRINQIAKEINRLEKVKEQLVNDNKSLRMEIASLSRLSRISGIAAEELGMQYPDRHPVVFKVRQPAPGGLLASAAFIRMRAVVTVVRNFILPAAAADPAFRNSRR